MGTWMLYAILVSALLGIGAVALERVLVLYHGSTRPAWIVSITLSLVLPVALLRSAAPDPERTPLEIVSSTATGVSIPAMAMAAESSAGVGDDIPVDTMLLSAWMLSSALMLLWMTGSYRSLRNGRRRWRRETVSETGVLVSASAGPAVVGVLHPEIVLPEWVLALEEERRRLVVEHEVEHLRAGDSPLLLASLLVLVLCPWNPALWWQVRRLRLAVEVDCDARVLRRRPDARNYGALLLEVGRMASRRQLLATAFSKPHSFLERRIRMITRSDPRHRFRTAAGLALAALGAPLAACALTPPEAPGVATAFVARTLRDGDRVRMSERIPATQPSRSGGVLPGESNPRVKADRDARLQVPPVQIAPPEERLAPDTVMPRLQNPSEVREALVESYPPLLYGAGIGGTVLLELYADEQGRVRETRVVRATHDALVPAAKRALSVARFSPARVDGSPVARRFTIPVNFVAPAAEEGDLPPISSARIGGRSLTLAPGAAGEEKAIRDQSVEVSRAAQQTQRRAEEGRRQASTVRTWQASVRAVEPVLRAHYPQVAEHGTGKDSYVWFFVDPEDTVLESGINALHLTPSERTGEPVWHVETVRGELLGARPSLTGVEEVRILRTTRGGNPLNVAWITVTR